MFPIIILDGPDASGKTTLANQIMAKYQNHVYLHNGVCDNILDLHKSTLNIAFTAAKTHVVIIDRLYLSEYVYGTVFRNGPSYNLNEITEFIRKYNDEMHSLNLPLIHEILCITNKETSLKIHDERKDVEMFDNISKVWDMYNDINYPNIKRYDWQKHNIDLNDFTISDK